MENSRFYVTKEDLEGFCRYLQEKENSTATIEKYLRDVKKFAQYAGLDTPVDKERLLAYKEWLTGSYAVSSVNSMLAALNQFLIFKEKGALRLRRIKVQRSDMFHMERALEKEDFQLLVRTAREHGRSQIAMMMETMCATGIRVSELKFFSVESVRIGMVRVCNKGKQRLVLLSDLLKKKLLAYTAKQGIRSGRIFQTRGGREKDRSNIWKEMKQIAAWAGVALQKVFPHNLRHLFARTFYQETKNLLNLADILGHSNLEVTRIYASDGIREWKRNLEKIGLIESIT